MQRVHIEGKERPLSVRFSSVGSLLKSNVQDKRDFEGGN